MQVTYLAFQALYEAEGLPPIPGEISPIRPLIGERRKNMVFSRNSQGAHNDT